MPKRAERNEEIGEPLEPRYEKTMMKLGARLGEILGPDTGFVLLVFPFESDEGRCNYISNARREDVKTLLKEQLARFEGQPYIRGRA